MINTEVVDGISTITVRGEFDRANQSVLREFLDNLLRERQEDQVKLDFTAVNFMDSTCGRLLSDCIESLKKSGQRIGLKLSPQVRRTLEFLNSAGLSSAGTTLATA